MADKGPVFNPIDDFKTIIFIVFLLWIFWVYSGGPAKYEASQKILLKPAWPLDTGESYGEISIGAKPDQEGSSNKAPDIQNGLSKESKISNDGAVPADEAVTISDEKRTSATNPLLVSQNIGLSKGQSDLSGRSYLVLDFPASNSRSLILSGKALRGIFGSNVILGRASRLPYQGVINAEDEIVLAPGERALLIDGESPVGVSFRVNKCFGYLTQFQQFFPSITVNCPECRNDKSEDLNYNSCVRSRKNDPDFFTNEWRIYLNNTGKIWNETGDIIRLFDQSGKSIASVVY